MISGGIEVNWFAQIRLILEAKFSNDPSVYYFKYRETVTLNKLRLIFDLRVWLQSCGSSPGQKYCQLTMTPNFLHTFLNAINYHLTFNSKNTPLYFNQSKSERAWAGIFEKNLRTGKEDVKAGLHSSSTTGLVSLRNNWTFYALTPKNGQTHSNNSSAVTDELSECVWPFCGFGD